MNGTQDRGALIVLEGCDCSGKSTQCRRIVEKLRSSKIQAELVSFPDRTTPIGSLINDYLKKDVHVADQVIHLLFAANRWERAEELKSLVNKGVTVVVDRYSYSGVAYSAAKKVPCAISTWQIIFVLHVTEYKEAMCGTLLAEGFT
uniref:dTMP kinase n=1 Tax=Lygus hesperus TaxID=30085 RepID=A0A146M3Y3_LYGHE